MPTTSSAALRYPASSAAPNVPADIQNLATDLDHTVVVQVATTTARNALTKYDGMLVYEQSSKRHFRWDAGASLWNYVAGPVYTWTPTLVDPGSSPVTGTITTRGIYIIIEGKIRFAADFFFASGTIDGKVGNLSLTMPSGVVAKSTDPVQANIRSQIFLPGNSRWVIGGGYVALSATKVSPTFPASPTDCYALEFRNATGAGVTGSGVPLVSGSYPLVVGTRLNVSGEYELASWTAL